MYLIVPVVTDLFLLGSALIELNPPDIAILLQAMERSFDPFGMQRVLLERTGLRLFNITAPFKPFSDQVVDIHQHFDHRNTTEQLIATLRDARPSVPAFAMLADQAGFAISTRPTKP